MSGFDIPEQQVGLWHDDPGFSFHHRILLLPCGPPGRWIWCSTDYDVEVGDLADYLIVPIGRGALFPVRMRGDCYSVQPLNRVGLDRARAEARALALVLGIAPAAPAGAGFTRWTYSDTAHEKFSQPVEDDLLRDPVNLTQRGSFGLLDQGPAGITVVENVLLTDLAA